MMIGDCSTERQGRFNPLDYRYTGQAFDRIVAFDNRNKPDDIPALSGYRN
jgi:hypothetical protein